jgi:transposase
MSATVPSSDPLQKEHERLRREVNVLEAERQQLQLQVRMLKQRLWGPKSERQVSPTAESQRELFGDPAGQASSASAQPAAPIAKPAVTRSGKPRQPMGPKPIDPSLPRETIEVEAPSVEQLICPETKRPMQPGFVEELEVLARKPAQYYVKHYRRTVFVSPAKVAPVYAPWPADVLPRSRMHASVVAHLATAHYCDHLPFHRIEQQLARVGVDLPRNCQVSLMRQLDRLVAPLVKAMKQLVLASGYLMVDATPVKVCDPQRPGATREATLWAFRSSDGAVWFEYQPSKSPEHPDRALKEANFEGLLQTDGASRLGSIGPPGQVISLGCFAHLRRYFFEASRAGERQAEPYLQEINRLFRIDRMAKHFRLKRESRQHLRQRHSLPLFEQMLARAEAESLHVLPKSPTGKALHYLLAQREPLRRCLEQARAQLSTNAVERAIRPLKIGAKNWLHVGHPQAGPRLANLFTVVENCRLAGVDPEAYLIDLLTRLLDHPARRIAELFPWAWAQRPQAATTAVAGSGADQFR